ncbi:GlcG/HbpS family heme-binding protein [Trinickia violacea]|uniref:GlcG/HbpS family heme-binding protein n=1 Tax=Trinickia violacea TaxID=2571746 RepID=UPI001C2FF284|nr:heme-binding protein [Trinickia violacea]
MKFKFSIQQLAQVAIASLGFAGVVHSVAAGEAGALAPAPAYSLSYAQTEKLIGLAVAAANARHLAMSFAVVDPGGHLIAAARMDGAPFASLDFARGKAFASVALGGQSGTTLEQRYRDDPSEYSNVSGAGYYAPFLPAGGTFPVFSNGHLLGALGASGAPSAIDDQVVKQAIEALGASTVR